ncbi:hypothetical protein NL676_020377 [Syzygium grande]|nr:hypothetical protein NL676_020377 [Syzygium grande]
MISFKRKKALFPAFKLAHHPLLLLLLLLLLLRSSKDFKLRIGGKMNLRGENGQELCLEGKGQPKAQRPKSILSAHLIGSCIPCGGEDFLPACSERLDESKEIFVVKASQLDQLRLLSSASSSEDGLSMSLGGRVVLVVFKGCLDEKGSSQSKRMAPIAIKILNPKSMQAFKEGKEIGEKTSGVSSVVNFLGSLSHPNIVRLMGYCLEDKEQLLVHEFIPKGTLNNHLFGRGLGH